MFLSENLRNILTTHLHLVEHLTSTGLAHWFATEQSRHTHVATWADHVLAWAADWALGRVALEHLSHVRGALHWENAHTLDTGRVLATGIAGVLAHLAHHLGADRAGDLNVPVSVLDVHGRALGVLVVLGLGGVLDALDGLDDVLARRGLVDHATLHVHVGSWLGGGRGSHFICNNRLEINYTQPFQRLLQVPCY